MTDSIGVILKGLEKWAEESVVKVSLDITADLIEATPVDTGWARANWVPQIGSPYIGGSGRPGNVGMAASAQSRGQASLLGFKITMKRIYISNNVPYINRLNNGYSLQAPAGFVQRAIATGAAKGFAR